MYVIDLWWCFFIYLTLVAHGAVADIQSWPDLRQQLFQGYIYHVGNRRRPPSRDADAIFKRSCVMRGLSLSFFPLGLQQSTIPSICRESRNNKMSRTRPDMEPRITSFFQRCADAQVDLIEWDHPLLARLNYPLVVDKASGTSFLICPRIADKN